MPDSAKACTWMARAELSAALYSAVIDSLYRYAESVSTTTITSTKSSTTARRRSRFGDAACGLAAKIAKPQAAQTWLNKLVKGWPERIPSSASVTAPGHPPSGWPLHDDNT